MNWADAIKERAAAAMRERAAPAETALDKSRTSSWDPYEVWLTRVRQPRELAATGRSSRVLSVIRGAGPPTRPQPQPGVPADTTD